MPKISTPPNPPISQRSELRDYSDNHVAYEIDMLLMAAHFSAVRLSAARLQDFFANARTEAFALHLRNLIQFLFPDSVSVRKEDVCAHHFLPPPTAYQDWLTVRPPLSPALSDAKDRADKELAHLTTGRIAGTPPSKHWQVCPLVKEVSDVLTVFAARADPTSLGAKAYAAISNLSAWVIAHCSSGASIGNATTTPHVEGDWTPPVPRTRL